MPPANPTSYVGKSRLLLARLVHSEYLILGLSLVWFICVLPFTPGLASVENLGNILASMLPLLVVATGETFVLISGGIDLSVTAIIALASVFGGLVMSGSSGWLAGHPLAVPGGVAAMLAVGAGVGAFNGAAIAQLKMPAFMVTLTTMMFGSGFAIWLTKSENISELPAAFTIIGGKTWVAILLTAGLAGLAHAILSRSLYGRWLYAIGHNTQAAFISGVPVKRVALQAYIFCGICAAVASILYTGRLETASPVHGQRILLDVIGATVIGGTSLFGGRGKILGTVFGVLFLTLIDNSLNLLNCTYFAIMMVKGGVILLAAVLDAARIRLEAR